MKYLVHQIGCIECGVSSYPIKVVDTIEEAVDLANAHPNTWESEGGEGYTSIYDLIECKEVNYK